MEELDILEEYKKEAAHKFTKGRIKGYGIATVSSNETSMHVFIPDEGVTWRKFPPQGFKIPKLQFEEDVHKEKGFDFLLTNFSAHGFFISERAKTILEKYNLGNHKFYPAKVVLQKGGFFKKDSVAPYYWLHFVFDEAKDDFIDFKGTTFRERVSLNGDLIAVNNLTFNSREEWQRYSASKHEEWLIDSDNNPYHERVPWEVALHKNLPDVINFGRMGSGLYFFSEALAKDIKNNALKGIEISATNIIKQQE